MAAAIDRFKASGKQVVAWGASYDQRQYFLAAHAERGLPAPDGPASISKASAAYRNYYRDALDQLGVTVNLIRVGTYKSFAEPYIGNGPSPAAPRPTPRSTTRLWSTYTDGVEKARKLPAGTHRRAASTRRRQRLAAARGDTAKLALPRSWSTG